jgi:hypothetical protein
MLEKSSENGVWGQQNEVIISPEELDMENQKIARTRKKMIDKFRVLCKDIGVRRQ